MIEAEIKKKIPKLETWEDVLTSNVFGLLELIDYNHLIAIVLKAKNHNGMFIENNLQDKLFLVNLIHDECSAEVNEDFAEEGLQILKSKMIEGAQFFCEKVKMDAEGNINTNWSK